MPLFKYRAIDQEGKPIEGTMEEASARRLTAILKERGYQVNAVEEVGKRSGFLRAKPKLTWEDIDLLNEQLLAITKSGLPLAPSLKAVAEDIKSKRLKLILADVRTQIEAGSTLEEAFSRHPESFSPVYLSIIRAGERSGNLSGVLSHLCAYSARMVEIKSNMQQAMAYPAFVLVAICAILYVLLVKVVPTFREIFKDFGAALPPTTVFWIKLSSFVLRHSVAIVVWAVVGIVVLRFLLRLALRVERMRCVLDAIKLRVPVFGGLYYMASVSRFCWSLGLLLASKVPLLESLDLASAAAGNAVLRKVVTDATRVIEGGERISEALGRTGFFRHSFCWTLSTAESRGEVDRALLELADTYETGIRRTDKLIAMLTWPVSVVVLGIIVGFLVLSMYLPIFSLADALSAPGGHR